jgi:protein involved in polysaccharide export with SLBB domain
LRRLTGPSSKSSRLDKFAANGSRRGEKLVREKVAREIDKVLFFLPGSVEIALDPLKRHGRNEHEHAAAEQVDSFGEGIFCHDYLFGRIRILCRLVPSNSSENRMKCIAVTLAYFAGLTGSDAQAPVASRQLAPGDSVELRCPESARYCIRRTLSPAGEILLPDLPPVNIAGSTPFDAAQLLDQVLERSGRLSDARLEIRAIEGHALTVSVSGLVSHPETRYLSPGMTIPELLAEAGLQPGADAGRVIVTPVDGIPRAVNLLSSSTVLHPGDHVEAIARIAHSEVFVIGGVEAPGAIPFEPGMTVAQAVNRVGGVSGVGRAGQWRVAHARKAYVTLGDGPDATGVQLSAGDTLEVPLTEPMTALSVIGAVVTPSRVEFRKGLHLSAVLRAAGGLRPDAIAAGVAIRSADGKVTTAASGDPILKPGDWIIVPSSG